MYHSMSFVWSSFFLSLWTFWTHLIPLLLYNKGPFEGGTSHLNILLLIFCTVQLELQVIPSLSYLLTLKGYFQKLDYIMFMRHNFFWNLDGLKVETARIQVFLSSSFIFGCFFVVVFFHKCCTICWWFDFHLKMDLNVRFNILIKLNTRNAYVTHFYKLSIWNTVHVTICLIPCFNVANIRRTSCVVIHYDVHSIRQPGLYF